MLAIQFFRAKGLQYPPPKTVTVSIGFTRSLPATGRFLRCYPSRLTVAADACRFEILPVQLPPRQSAVGVLTVKIAPLVHWPNALWKMLSRLPVDDAESGEVGCSGFADLILLYCRRARAPSSQTNSPNPDREVADAEEVVELIKKLAFCNKSRARGLYS